MTTGRLAQALVLALAVAASVLPQAPATAAAVPVPLTRAFPAAIEPFAADEPQTQCDPALKPGVVKLRELLWATYATKTFGTPPVCDVATESGQKEGRALDWTVSAADPKQKALADGFLTWLLARDKYGNAAAMARRLGVQEVIWNRRVWSADRAAAGWRPYYGADPHTGSVHLALGWDGATATTSFFTGRVVPRTRCGLPPAPRLAPALAATGTTFVPLPVAHVLDTRTGYGLPRGQRCRLAQESRLDLPVLGRGGVPAAGVSAVVLTVASHYSSAPTVLGAYPTGGQGPGTAVLSSPAGVYAAATTVVPLGADGMVTLTTRSGSTDVSVDVAGYYRSTGGTLFHPASPLTALSPGPATALQAGGRRELRLGGWRGVPAGGLRGFLLSLTVPRSAGTTALVVYPRGGTAAGGVPVPVLAGRPAATTRVFARTDAAGGFVLENRGRTAVQVQVDLHGWYAAPAVPGGTRFVPVPPVPVVDTAAGRGIGGALAAGKVAAVPVAGVGRVPRGSAAVALQVTALVPGTDTGLTLWPAGRARPSSRDLTLARDAALTNLVVVRLGPDGRLALHNQAGAARVVATVVGYYR